MSSLMPDSSPLNVLGAVHTSTAKAAKGLTEYQTTLQKELHALIEHVENLDEQLLHDENGDTVGDLSVTGVMLWEQCVKRCRETLGTLSTQHREMHTSVSKIGKEVDRTFTADFTGIGRKEHSYEKSASSRDAVNNLIIQRMVAHGRFDVAECLQRESGARPKTTHRQRFAEISGIRDAIETHNLTLALKWCEDHSEELTMLRSDLPRLLHRQQFVQLLMGDRKAQMTAIKYMRQNIAEQYPQEIGRLMGALVCAPRSSSSISTTTSVPMDIEGDTLRVRYDNLTRDGAWAELADVFNVTACRVYHLPTSDPLTTVLSAGVVALPQLLELRNVMKSRQVLRTVHSIWSNHSDELPIEIGTGRSTPYHSVFACPILRQQSTDANPPVRLACGHCISRDALNKLQHSNRLKCPYCPMESLVSDTLVLRF